MATSMAPLSLDNDFKNMTNQTKAWLGSVFSAINTARDNAAEHGDIGFVVLCAALVFIMTPGLGFFYSGMARSKNALSLIMLSFLSMALVLIQWLCFGFSLSFSDKGNPFIGDCFYCGIPARAGDGYLRLETEENRQWKVNTITFFIYQAMFAAVTPALIFGAIAERIRMTWAENGWLNTLGTYDYAGGCAIHIAAGFSGLAMAIVLGKRHGYGENAKTWKPHSLNNVLLGTALLWFGWFGFNGGSGLAGSSRAANAATVSNLAAGAGGVVWMFMDYRGETKRLSALAFCSGCIAGLVAATPSCGFVPPWSGIVIGAVSGFACNLCSRVKHVIGVDDTLDAFSIHGIGGIVGMLMTAFFAQSWVPALDNDIKAGGWIEHNYAQMGYQLAACAASAAWSFLLSAIFTVALLKILKLPQQLQERGVDTVEFGETAYDIRLTRSRASIIQPEIIRRVAEANAKHEKEKEEQKSAKNIWRPTGSIFRARSWVPPFGMKVMVQQGTATIVEENVGPTNGDNGLYSGETLRIEDVNARNGAH